MFKFINSNNLERFGEVVKEKAKNTGRPTSSGNGSIMIDKAAAIRLCKLAGGCAAVLQVENDGGANGYTFKDADGKPYDAKIGYSLRYPNEDGTPIGRGIDMIFIKDQPDYQDPTETVAKKTLADTCKESSDINIQNALKSKILVVNTSPGAPDWCQFTIKQQLIDNELFEEDEISFVEDSRQNFKVPKISQIITFSMGETYKLGNVITFEGETYICLVSNDVRGAAFSGAYGQSPKFDTFAWKKIKLSKKLSMAGKLAAAIKDQTKASIADTKQKEAEVNEAKNQLVAAEMEKKKQEDIKKINEQKQAVIDSTNSSGPSSGMIIAGILIVLVIIALIYFFVIKKKNKSIENVSELSDSSEDSSSSE